MNKTDQELVERIRNHDMGKLGPILTVHLLVDAADRLTTLSTENEALRLHLAQIEHQDEQAEAEGLSPGPVEFALLQAETQALRVENDKLRASLANGPGPCVYCSLPKEEWSRCASGFPGCARGDDAMLCPHVGAELETQATAQALRVRLEEAESVMAQIDRRSTPHVDDTDEDRKRDLRHVNSAAKAFLASKEGK